MHRVDASGHVANMFSPGDPANGIVPTQLDHEWHNAVQENMCQLIEGAGIALVKGDHTQLMDAVAAMITTAQLTAAQILARLITVDGAGSALDADTVDGLHAAAFVLASNYTAADVLAKLLTVDGPGSGLNADLLDGQDSAYFANIPARLGYTPVNKGGDTITSVMEFVTGSNSSMASLPSGSAGPQAKGNGTGPAVMTFHRPSSFAAFLGLDTDNKLKWGGWSLGAVAYELWHAGNDGAGSGADADLLDGQDGAYYTNIPARLGFTPVRQGGGAGQGANTVYIGWSGTRLKAQVDASDLGNLVFDSNYTAADVLAKLLTVDGAGSAVDADTVDGLHASAFALNSGFTSGTSANGYWRKLPDGTIEQWCVGVGAASGEATEFITFPMAFPTEVLGLTVSTQLGGASTGADVWYQNLAPSLSGVTVQRQKASGGSDGVTTIPRIYAIGR